MANQNSDNSQEQDGEVPAGEPSGQISQESGQLPHNPVAEDEAMHPDHGFWSMTLVPFRKALVRGLAVVMPPLLTIVLLIWAWNTLDSYVLRPMESAASQLVVWTIADIRSDAQLRPVVVDVPANAPAESVVPERINGQVIDDHEYVKTDSGSVYVRIRKSWIPRSVFDEVNENPGQDHPNTSAAYYHRYVQLRFLRREVTIPLFLIVFVIILYLSGKTLAVGVGRMAWNYAESFVNKVPLIRNVYSSVKQVTDFAFNENEIQCRRIVALEYPRKGIWSLGFVTGEGMLDIRAAANEPIVTVLVPTSPMPATGFTVSVPKSDTIDLNITMDQAIQFCVSCGVVVPNMQMVGGEVAGKARLTGKGSEAVRHALSEAADRGSDNNSSKP